MNDSFYTPSHLAKYITQRCTTTAPTYVADFAAGDGALLKEAEARWPGARFVATDIDQSAVERLRKSNHDWDVSKCNFFLPESRGRAAALKHLSKSADVILLNPPFSCKGSQRVNVTFQEENLACSRALAFLVLSINYLSANGEIAAILPESTFSSEKDFQAWSAIRTVFTIQKGSTANRGVFDGCFAKCSVVHLRRRVRAKAKATATTMPTATIQVRMVRGSVPMHIQTGSDRVLVHSTDLYGAKVTLNGHVASRMKPSIIGPCVLLPRVGKPRIDKVCLFVQRRRVALSDCVIGLECESSDEARWLHAQIIEHERDFYKLYSGTCAQYTTVRRLTTFLAKIGCQVQ